MDVVANPSPTPRRTKRRGRHPDKALSAAFVRSAPPGRHADGNGLYLFVQPSGTRSWVQRLVIRGRRPRAGPRQPDAGPLGRRSSHGETPRPGRSDLRRSRPTGARTEARRLARPVAREELVAEHAAPTRKSRKILLPLALGIPPVRVPLVAPIVPKRIPAHQGRQPRARKRSVVPVFCTGNDVRYSLWSRPWRVGTRKPDRLPKGLRGPGGRAGDGCMSRREVVPRRRKRGRKR